MKYICLIIIMAMSLVNTNAQSLYLNEEFTNGIPEDYALYDVDGLQPSTDMTALGFSIGTPWIVIEDNANQVACSTYCNQPAGTSNDCLSTRDFIVTDANAI